MNESAKLIVISAAAAFLGLGAGYMIAEKRLSAQFEERLDRETAEMKAFYTTVKKKYDTPEAAVAALIPDVAVETVEEDPRLKAQKVAYHKVVKTEEYSTLVDEDEGAKAAEDELIHHNVFKTIVTPDSPYVVSQDEFMANEDGFDQATMTYYEKGGVVVDERDDPFDNVLNVLGPDFMHKFGEGSSDENVVHIRNHALRMDFEVCRSERSYEEDVLGEESTASESPRDRVRRER